MKNSVQSIIAIKFVKFMLRYLEGFVAMTVSKSGILIMCDRTAANALIHAVKILLARLLEIWKRSARSLRSRPKRSHISTKAISSMLVRNRLGPNLDGVLLKFLRLSLHLD